MGATGATGATTKSQLENRPSQCGTIMSLAQWLDILFSLEPFSVPWLDDDTHVYTCRILHPEKCSAVQSSDWRAVRGRGST
jgi:hypothetical protein